MICKTAASMVVALAVIWGGGTWYTGTQIQSRIDKDVKEFNFRMRDHGDDRQLTARYENFDNGFFSSHFKLFVKIDKGAASLGMKTGQEIGFDIDVIHGPLPLIFHGDFTPAMVAAKLRLVNNELTQPLFTAAKDKSPGEATIRFSYDGSYSTVLDVMPAQYTGLSFGNGQFAIGKDDSGLSNLQINGEVENVVMSVNNDKKVIADSLNVDTLLRLEEKSYPIGNIALKFNQATLSERDAGIFKMDALIIKTSSERAKNSKYINANLTYVFEKIKKENQDIGSGQVSLVAESIDPLAVRAFISQYGVTMREYFAKNSLESDDANYKARRFHSEFLIANMPILFKSEPVIKFPVSWNNAGGELTGSLDIAFKDPGNIMPATVKAIKSVNADFVAPITFATEMIKQSKLAQGMNAKDAQSQAQKEVNDIKQYVSMLNLLMIHENNASLRVRYVPGQVNFNGRQMADDQFMALLKGLSRR